MPLFAWVGMGLGFWGILVLQAHLRRLPPVVRWTLSLVSCALLFGSAALGAEARNDRRERELRTELAGRVR